MTPLPSHPEPVMRPGVPGLPPGASREPVFPAGPKKPVAEATGHRAHAASPVTMRSGASTPNGVPGRAAFTLVELLVVISIILVLMGLIGSAVSAARGSQRVQATQALITKLDRVVQQHYSSYASRVVAGGTSAADRATKLRLLATHELPDNWASVEAITTNTAGVPRTPPQSANAGVFQAIRSLNSSWPTPEFADAECLFMIVMMGGVADCLDCDALATSQKGDTDNDGAFEFLDAWGQPIRYVLWPVDLKLPPTDVGFFFEEIAPFTTGTSTRDPAPKGGTMRPLIFSGGPQQPFLPPVISKSGTHVRAGAITNFDAEARK